MASEPAPGASGELRTLPVAEIADGDATNPRPTGFPCLFAEPRDGLGEARRPETKRLRQPLIFILDASLRFNDLINRWPIHP